MDNYNVLVLMQRDKDTNILTDTIDSYIINYDMQLIDSVYMIEEDKELFVYFTLTTKDIEEWQYYGVYDLYNEEIYQELVEDILDGSGEYNPRWILKIKYLSSRADMEDKVNQLLKLHSDELERIFPIIEKDREKYQKEAENED